MSCIISVKDSLYNEGDRYDFEADVSFEPVSYMGAVSFKNAKATGFYFADGKNVRFSGKIDVDCVFECDRCLKEFEKSFTFSFSEMFSHSSEEENLVISRNDTVDIQPLLFDTVLSALPIERLCKEDCKGLCQHCGIDKNFSSCSCTDGDEDNPFAVLRGLVD